MNEIVSAPKVSSGRNDGRSADGPEVSSGGNDGRPADGPEVSPGGNDERPADGRKVSPGGTAALRIDGLLCRLDGRVVLDLPRLHVAAGERVALIGPNGAGKSTLLRLISGFIRSSAGVVDVLGQRLPAGAGDLRRLRGRIGQVLQGLHLVQRLDALDNVRIGSLGRRPGWRGWARWPDDAEIARAMDALARVGLAGAAATRVDRLSGGERQRVAIARLLMQQPALILADEPTASLDPQASDEVCALLDVAARGATLISVVHNPALLPRLCDRVIGLRAGRVAFDLPLADLDAGRLEALYRADGQAAEHAGKVSRLAPVLRESPT